MPIVHRVATFNKYPDAGPLFYAVLFKVSSDYPPVNGRLHTRYAPVRRSPSTGIATRYAAPRLACVRPAASVYPEPGSNSPLSNPSPDSLLKSTSPLLYTPLPIFPALLLVALSALAISSFQRTLSLTDDPSPHLSSLAGPAPFAGAKVIPFFFSIQIFFPVFWKKFFKTFGLPHPCSPFPEMVPFPAKQDYKDTAKEGKNPNVFRKKFLIRPAPAESHP